MSYVYVSSLSFNRLKYNSWTTPSPFFGSYFEPSYTNCKQIDYAKIKRERVNDDVQGYMKSKISI